MFNRINLAEVCEAQEIEIHFCDEFGKHCQRQTNGDWRVVNFGHVRNHAWRFERWFYNVLTSEEVLDLCHAANSPDDEVRVTFGWQDDNEEDYDLD